MKKTTQKHNKPIKKTLFKLKGLSKRKNPAVKLSAIPASYAILPKRIKKLSSELLILRRKTAAQKKDYASKIRYLKLELKNLKGLNEVTKSNCIAVKVNLEEELKKAQIAADTIKKRFSAEMSEAREYLRSYSATCNSKITELSSAKRAGAEKISALTSLNSLLNLKLSHSENRHSADLKSARQKLSELEVVLRTITGEKNLYLERSASLKKEIEQNMKIVAELKVELNKLAEKNNFQVEQVKREMNLSNKIFVDNLQLEKKALSEKVRFLETENIKLREDYFIREDKLKKEMEYRSAEGESIRKDLERKVKSAEEFLQKERQLMEHNLKSAQAEADKYRMELSIRNIFDKGSEKENGDKNI